VSDRSISDRSIEDVEVDGVHEREGLPSGYRMRADRHYVDQLAAPAAGQPVRMLPIAQVELDAPRPQADLRPLIESIRVHGIVQPLLVRRRDARFVVVAGRKRLLAAQMLRLQSLPCLVHELNEAEAAALAAADNLTIGEPARVEEGSPDFAAVRRLIATHLATIRSCADMNAAVRDTGPLSRSAFDLLRAHAWRAAQLLTAADVISSSVTSSASVTAHSERALATIVDEVIDGFAAEARLGGFVLRADIREALSSSGLNHRQLLTGLIGALTATLPLIEQVVRPSVTIKASGTGAAGVLFEVMQTDAPVDPRLVKQFFRDDLSIDRPGGYAATLGALVVKAVAEQHGGDATFEALDCGSRLTMLVVRRS
jgi:ParB-like nuclease family protein